MATQTHPGQRRRRRFWADRAPALAVAAGLTILLVVLASSVFSIAGRSRAVAARSVALHSLNETLRVSTSVRTQIAFASYLAEVDSSYGTDSSRAIEASIEEAKGSLATLEATTSSAAAGGFDGQTSTALVRFERAARRALEAATGPRPAAAGPVVRERVAPSFAVLRDRLVSRRDAALAEVKSAGSLLGRLGGLATFVIAFVLPTVAVLVYRGVTRRTRESIGLATALARERGRADRRRQLLSGRLEELQRELADIEALAADDRLTAVSRLRWKVDALVTVITGTHRLAFARVDLATELASITDALRAAEIEVDVASADGAAWADPVVLGTVLRSLVLEAREAGARRIELGAAARGEHATVVVAHDGARLTSAVASLVFDRAHDGERASVEAGEAPILLLAAQESIEAMEGSLAELPGGGRAGFVLSLPVAADHATGASTPRAALAHVST